MLDSTSHVKVKPGSERGFGIVWAVVLVLVGLYPLLQGAAPRWWALLPAAALVAIALFAAKWLAVPNRLWFRFGLLLGHVVGSLIMTLVYVIVVVPTGGLMRLTGKDPLRLDMKSGEPSYWIVREADIGSMKDQF